MNFDIKTEQLSDDAFVIALRGEVDLYTAPEFKQQLLEVIGQGGKQVVVDFSDTTFIDSTTLGVLVGGVKRLRSNEGVEAGLSVPSPTRTPASRSSRRGATPQPRIAFERGQWATATPCSARSPISSASTFTQCAARTPRSRRPWAAR